MVNLDGNGPIMQLNALIRHLRAVTEPVPGAPDTRRALVTRVIRPADASPALIDITGITADSRRVEPGSLFAAVPGVSVDGHVFAPDAARRGAAALIVERPLRSAPALPQIMVTDARRALAHAAAILAGHPSRRLRVVGITGTNGKSTTACLVQAILDAAGRRAGLIGTISYRVGRRTIPAPLTTPDSVTLQALMADMVDEGLDSVVMEVSSHALDQHRTDAVDFDVACFTHLSSDHGDYHPTPEHYRDAKGRLFEGLRPGATAVLNTDDDASLVYVDRTQGDVLWYGPDGDVVAEVTERSLAGSRFTLYANGDSATVRTRLIGRHNVENAAAAAACALALGIPLHVAAAGIESLACVPGRLERVDAGQPFTALVDYAHTDDALDKVLRSLRPLVDDRRLIVVFGAGGDRDTAKRPRMGAAAAATADSVWITSDNPRSEDPADILAQIAAGVPAPHAHKVRREVDRRRAIFGAVAEAREGDLVLVAGKGHERTQKLRDVEIPFDDCQMLREAITGSPRLSKAS